jgi:hypothetical protein
LADRLRFTEPRRVCLSRHVQDDLDRAPSTSRRMYLRTHAFKAIHAWMLACTGAFMCVRMHIRPCISYLGTFKFNASSWAVKHIMIFVTSWHTNKKGQCTGKRCASRYKNSTQRRRHVPSVSAHARISPAQHLSSSRSIFPRTLSFELTLTLVSVLLVRACDTDTGSALFLILSKNFEIC